MRRAWIAVLIAAVSGPVLAHTPLVVGGNETYWLEPSTTYGIGWAEYPEWDAAVRSAFSAWSTESTGLTVEEDEDLRGHATTGDPAHMVVFDPTNSTGWFTDPSIVAVTPVWVDGSGRIVDADIVLNGRDHTFSVDGQAGTFDLQSVLAHEVGHFYGFDHSGCYGSTLFPYVYQQDPSPRTLAPDDCSAARSLNPAGQIRVQGFVTRPGGAPIRGAHVIAVDATGHALAADVSRADGSFDVVGLEPGAAVRVFAEPLDGGVRDANLFVSVESDFQTVEWGGGPTPLVAGQVLGVGTLVCPAKTVSVTAFTSPSLEPGGLGSAVLAGQGLDPPVTFSVLGAPGVNVVGTTWNGSTWRVDLQVAPSAELGHRSLLLDAGGVAALVPGAFEVYGPQPTVTSVTPSTGEPGDSIVVEGANFQPGATVVVGGYPAPGAVIHAGRFEGTVPAGAGAVAVSVQNPDGRYVHSPNAFTFAGTVSADPTPPPWSGPAPAPAPPAPAASGGGGGGGGCSLGASSAPGPGWPWLVALFGLLLLSSQRT